jgi:hypothetical protein
VNGKLSLISQSQLRGAVGNLTYFPLAGDKEQKDATYYKELADLLEKVAKIALKSKGEGE